MMKKLARLLFALLLLVLQARASAPEPPDEGMWLPLLISQNYAEMQRMGLELTPQQLYNANGSSLKDAIVWFGGKCTGSFISNQGLVLTNHHCGYDAIHSHSTDQHNYLRDGFWAKSRTDEIPNPGLSISLLVRMQDVTAAVNAGDRTANITGIEAHANEGGKYTAVVKPLFGGNLYYLFVYQVYTDVRLVGAPPEALGKFGGETDNWVWPRHTADFSLFRVYAGPDNEPAAYNPNNVPYKPKHVLPISLRGIDVQDFALVYGYPGSTARYQTSAQIELAYTQVNPAFVAGRGAGLEVMKKAMLANESNRLKLANDFASLSNYYKFFRGQNIGLQKLGTIQQFRAQEAKFQQWVDAEATRQEQWGKVLPNIAQAVQTYKPYAAATTWYSQALMLSNLMGLSTKLAALVPRAGSKPSELQAKTKSFWASYRDAYRNYIPQVDQQVWVATVSLYLSSVPDSLQPDTLRMLLAKQKGKTPQERVQGLANLLYSKTALFDSTKLKALLTQPATLLRDPAIALAEHCWRFQQRVLSPRTQQYAAQAAALSKLYIQARMAQEPTRKWAPDANSTLRISYGKVRSYEPQDGVVYKHYTTLRGVMEKKGQYPPEEFEVPERLQQLYTARDYGHYADERTGELVVGFLTDTDIIGGNSGSPVINGKGQLVGLAFDMNWESTTGNLLYDDNFKRCINMDARYLLFLIDKYAGATHLVQEMQLVR